MPIRKISLPPLLILPLAVLLLQFHSIAFWSWAITGTPVAWGWPLLAAPWNGWGWSLLFELVNLWAWPRRWHLLAGVTTVLLVAGPLYQVSDPLVRDLSGAQAAELHDTPRIRALREEIAALEATLAAYRADWRLRPRVPEAQADLSARHEELAALLGEQEAAARAARLDWRRWAVIAGQLLGILIAQAGAVMSVLALSVGRLVGPALGQGVDAWQAASRSSMNPLGVPTNGSSPPANVGEPGERPEKAAIREFARRRALSTQRAVAEAISEPPSTLSEFANGRPLPEETRRRIWGALQTR
jgi:hypothetical protein